MSAGYNWVPQRDKIAIFDAERTPQNIFRENTSLKFCTF